MGDRHPDGVRSYPADAQQIASHVQAQEALSQLPVPILTHRDNPHEYLFLALFDGTGQDANRPDRGPLTNVGMLKEQAEALEQNPSNRIAKGYVEGIGTQDNRFVATADQALAFSWDERIEDMYREFAAQSWEWLQQDPQAQIRIAEVGYSRGAALIPGFARLVDQYGILDPSGELRFGRDERGQITIHSDRPPLVPPGQVAQAVGLFDPVATNLPRDYDARLPPSVISGFTMLAADERRKLFPHTALIDQNMTADGRFLGVTVGGAHSNVGGGNTRNGMEILAGNTMIHYLNSLRDVPYLEPRPVPSDPELMVVHRSDLGRTGAYGLFADEQGSPRAIREQLADCVVVNPCRDAEPRNAALAGQFEYRTVEFMETIAPTRIIEQTPLLLNDPRHADYLLFRGAADGVYAIDARHNRTSDARSDQLAASLAVAARQSGLHEIDHVLMSKDASHTFAIQGRQNDPAQHRIMVETVPAMDTPLAQSTQRMAQVDAEQTQKMQRQALAQPQVEDITSVQRGM